MSPTIHAIGCAMVALCLGVVAAASDALAQTRIDPGMFSFERPSVLPSTVYTLTLIGMATQTIEPDADAAIPLRDVNGRPLGPVLSDGQFCELAAAGSGVIGNATYRVAGTSREPQVSCRRYFSRLARKMPVAAGALGRSVFERIETPYGLGAERYRLVPWRSVAAARFKVGTVLFIPALRGRRIGGPTIHDGFVFVADRLGDAPPAQMVLVVDSTHPAPDLPSGEVTGFVVDERAVVAALHRAHAIQ
ncbi:MAG: hypothetical protein ACKVQT_29655 [Burkholderiales bacterium]